MTVENFVVAKSEKAIAISKAAKMASSAQSSTVADGEMLTDGERLIGKYPFSSTIISTVHTCFILGNFQLTL